MEIKRVGVVSCGTMACGIAQVCAQAGYQTVVSEVNEELLSKGLGSIGVSLARSVEKGRMSCLIVIFHTKTLHKLSHSWNNRWGQY